jgi:hypothetical protein
MKSKKATAALNSSIGTYAELPAAGNDQTSAIANGLATAPPIDPHHF